MARARAMAAGAFWPPSLAQRTFTPAVDENGHMTISRVKAVVSLAVGVLYWYFVCQVSGAREPWDADAYWHLWYPLSFGLSAMTGLFFKRRGWMAGAILTFAQLPVMWLNTGTGPLWPVGLLTLCVLALPVAAISALTGRLAARRRST